MKECPFCKEDNMSKSVFCCMCGKRFPDEQEDAAPAPVVQNRRFTPFGQEEPAVPQTEAVPAAESKPKSRFKPM